MPENEIKNADIKVREYITTLREQLDEKDSTIAEQQDKIEHLNEVVSQYKKMIFGRKSEKKTYIMPEQLVFFNEAEAEADSKAPEPTEQTIVKVHSRNKKRTQEERFGGIPHDKEYIKLKEADCGNGHTMVIIGEEKVRTEIEIIPEQIVSVKYSACLNLCLFRL